MVASGIRQYFGVRNDIRNFDELKGRRLGLLDEYPRIIEIMEEGDIDACTAMEPNRAGPALLGARARASAKRSGLQPNRAR